MERAKGSIGLALQPETRAIVAEAKMERAKGSIGLALQPETRAIVAEAKMERAKGFEPSTLSRVGTWPHGHVPP